VRNRSNEEYGLYRLSENSLDGAVDIGDKSYSPASGSSDLFGHFEVVFLGGEAHFWAGSKRLSAALIMAPNCHLKSKI
jgi:hypothetical protein